jgi:DNA-binding NarL/FixJ family response regulator
MLLNFAKISPQPFESSILCHAGDRPESIIDADRLTRRESEVVVLLASRLDLETIATRLGPGRGTVRDHLRHVFDNACARS